MRGREGGEEEDPVDSLAGDRQGRVPEVVTDTDQQTDQARIREIVSSISLENERQVDRSGKIDTVVECLFRLSSTLPYSGRSPTPPSSSPSRCTTGSTTSSRLEYRSLTPLTFSPGI